MSEQKRAADNNTYRLGSGSNAYRLGGGSSTPSTSDEASRQAEIQRQQEEANKLAEATRQAEEAARPKTLMVPNEFTTIQSAIDAARTGDTVHVRAGTYHEQLTLKSGVQLIGDGADKVTVRYEVKNVILTVSQCNSGLVSDMQFAHIGKEKGDSGTAAVFCTASNIEFLRCKVSKAGGAGIQLTGKDNSSIRQCEFSGCGWSGIYVAEIGTNPVIIDNHCHDNSIYGIDVCDGACPRIENNECAGSYWAGIRILGTGTSPEVLGNRCNHNLGNGIIITKGAGPRTENNDCHNNARTGILVGDKGTAPALINNRCNNNGLNGIAIETISVPSAFSGNTASGNKGKLNIDRKATIVTHK